MASTAVNGLSGSLFLNRCLIVIRLWYVRQPANLPQGIIDWWAMNMPVIQEVPSLIPH